MTGRWIPLAQANGILSILWIALVIFAIVVGFPSDATRVRKPYMLVSGYWNPVRARRVTRARAQAEIAVAQPNIG